MSQRITLNVLPRDCHLAHLRCVVSLTKKSPLAQLSNGDSVDGDILVGSDGINSRVRDVFDPLRRAPVWSGYTCVAGMAYVVPPDIKEVGYKVWVGARKYFVSVDVGCGRIQWCAHNHVASLHGLTFRQQL